MKLCNAESPSVPGNKCTREAGHDTDTDPTPWWKRNPQHICRNEDGIIVQIWHEYEDTMESGNEAS